MTGIALATNTAGVAPRAHVHANGEGWLITSDVPLEDLLHTDILDRMLPGVLGRYIYPKDAVLTDQRTR